MIQQRHEKQFIRKHRGSILPSSSPPILNPIDCAFGELKVRVWPDSEDTYALVLTNKNGITVVASHPNGFPCYELARRMAFRPAEIGNQRDYIVRCGGTALSIEEISKVMETSI